MSSSIRKMQFLLDENVRRELFSFLQKMGYSAKIAPKGASDETLAQISTKEKRVIVTNDEDFSEYPESTVFSVVWLRILQNDPLSLTSSFAKLIDELKNFEGRLIILKKNKWADFPLTVDVKLKA